MWQRDAAAHLQVCSSNWSNLVVWQHQHFWLEAVAGLAQPGLAPTTCGPCWMCCLACSLAIYPRNGARLCPTLHGVQHHDFPCLLHPHLSRPHAAGVVLAHCLLTWDTEMRLGFILEMEVIKSIQTALTLPETLSALPPGMEESPFTSAWLWFPVSCAVTLV